MSKLIIIKIFLIFIIILIVIWYIYLAFTTKVNLNTNNITRISILVPDNSIDTRDKDKIIKVISYLRSIRYYKGNTFEIYNNSPDVFISFYNKDGNKVEEIKYYGDVVVYKDKKYGVIPFTYSALESLCNNINK